MGGWSSGADLEASLSGTFVSSVGDEGLRLWAAGEQWRLDANVTRNADGVLTSADIAWLVDGSAGTFTADTVNAEFAAVDAYTITHIASGRQVRQPDVTRDADGNVTDQPALIVEDIP